MTPFKLFYQVLKYFILTLRAWASPLRPNVVIKHQVAIQALQDVHIEYSENSTEAK